MSCFDIRRKAAAGLFLAAFFMAGPAVADKPDWAGGGKAERGGSQGKSEKREDKGAHKHADRREGNDQHDRAQTRDHDRERVHRSERSSESPRVAAYFGERHREVVHQYYGERFRAGDCPPGLAKKRNGCMPPGQARKWRIGSPLPRDVVWYDAPGEIVVRLGMPPEGHRYVRVAADILLIAVGTGMVVDAIEDLNRY